MKVCAVDDCDRAHVARGMCERHYRRWKNHGDVFTVLDPGRPRKDDGPTLPPVTCVICDASRLLDARGYSLHEAARQQRKTPAWLRQHLDDHGLSDVLTEAT